MFGRKIGDTSVPSVFANKPDAETTKNLVGVFGNSTKKTTDTVQKSIFSKKPETPTDNKPHSIPGITAEPEKKSLFGVSASNEQKKSIFGGASTAPKANTSAPSAAKSSLFGAKSQEEKPKVVEQPKPLDIKPLETKPVEAKKEEPKAVESKPVETKPVEIKPIETKPVDTKPTEAKTDEPKPSLFGGKASNIFGKSSTEKKEEPKKTGLFGSTNTTTQSGSLFAKKPVDNSEKKEEEKPKIRSLFGNNVPAGTTSTSAEPKKSLFGANTSGGLFSGTKKLFSGPSLFADMNKDVKPEDQKNSFITSGANNEEEKDEDEEKAKEEDKKPKFVAVSKDPYTKIFNRAVEKFRTSKHDKGNGIISIETGETDGKKFVLFNFRNPIGKTLFTGQILPSCKKAKALDKPGKIQAKVMVIEKDMVTGVMKPMGSLISFNRTDDLNEFEKKWDEAKEFLA